MNEDSLTEDKMAVIEKPHHSCAAGYMLAAENIDYFDHIQPGSELLVDSKEKPTSEIGVSAGLVFLCRATLHSVKCYPRDYHVRIEYTESRNQAQHTLQLEYLLHMLMYRLEGRCLVIIGDD